MTVDKVPSLDTTETVEMHLPEEPSFEEIEKEIGKMLIFIMRDRRNHYHAQSEVFEKEYKEQVKKQADSYRGWAPVIFMTGEIALASVTVLSFAAPQAVKGVIERTPMRVYLEKFYDANRQFKLPEMSQEITKISSESEKIFSSIKNFHSNAVGAHRTELSAYSELARSHSEQKRQEHQKYLGEEQEAMRNFNQARNKRDDFMMGYAR